MADQSLITTIVVGLGLAFVLGALAHRLRAPLLIGYLLAGVLIGPFTPGYVADQRLASQLAELGVILLMFGVGLHFSVHDLLSTKAVAIPGAIGQIVFVSALGAGLAGWMGWSWGAALVFGLALSIASTVVVLRTLQERHLVDTDQGRVIVGWLVVQDLAVVLALVLLPALANPAAGSATAHNRGWLADLIGSDALQVTLALTVVQLLGFFGLVVLVGQKVIPLILHYAAHSGSRELFRLAVLVLALGVAFVSAHLFGVSFALGAFFAGMVLAETTLSQQAARETLPLRDAFAVLFFVSVGMLFDPGIVLRQPGPVLATFLIVVGGNALAAFALVFALRRSSSEAFISAAALAQIGEFSFILAGLGGSLGLLPDTGRDLILAGAILSILANPLLFYLVGKLQRSFAEGERVTGQAVSADNPATPRSTRLQNHAVLVGYGRVGSLVAETLLANGGPLLVIEERENVVEAIRKRGIEAICANAAAPQVLEAANVAGARWFISAIPNPFENGNLIEHARALNPAVEIIARAHTDDEVAHLKKFGADVIIMGEREIAKGISNHIEGTLRAASPAN